MSINHVLLGLLRDMPLTGYDLKKRIQGSSFLPWSGNNNQIYKSLLELTRREFVTSQVVHQDRSPSKKVYTITEAGLSELKRWSRSEPEEFAVKKPFLLQFAWADLLDDEELLSLLAQYEREIETQILIAREKPATWQLGQGKTSRQTEIWDLLNDNILLTCRSELEWIKRVRTALFERPGNELGVGNER